MASATSRLALAPLKEGGKWIAYWLTGRIFHQPELLRSLASLLRALRLPSSAAPVAHYKTLAALFRRQVSFSNTAHAPNMPADRNFLIGMDAGPAHDSERRFLQDVLPSKEECARAAGVTSLCRIREFQAKPASDFNLVDDYMATIVWSALRCAFGSAATTIESGKGAAADVNANANANVAGCPMHKLFLELRYLGAHLIVGGDAPQRIQERAEQMAKDVNDRVEASVPMIQRAVRAFAPKEPSSVQRDAVGLMWVGHPATVQAGALIMQDLLARPMIYRALREQAQTIGESVWSDAPFRAELRAYVLESLRFRPPFPLLNRDVPRATTFDAGDRTIAAAAGSRVTLLTIGAMFDPDAVDQPGLYRPGRPDAAWSDIENRYLMFGYGPRSCIAKHQVVEILVSALAGLLLLPRLRYADPWWRRIGYEGPIIVRMRLRFD